MIFVKVFFHACCSSSWQNRKVRFIICLLPVMSKQKGFLVYNTFTQSLHKSLETLNLEPDGVPFSSTEGRAEILWLDTGFYLQIISGNFFLIILVEKTLFRWFHFRITSSCVAHAFVLLFLRVLGLIHCIRLSLQEQPIFQHNRSTAKWDYSFINP